MGRLFWVLAEFRNGENWNQDQDFSTDHFSSPHGPSFSNTAFSTPKKENSVGELCSLLAPV